MAFVRHHRSIASVHSSATSYCASPCRAQTSSQYTSPVESGSRSPETAATPASSSSARAFLDIAVQDAQPSRRHSSDGARRGVALRAHLDGALGPLPSALDVAGQHPLVRADDREPSVRGRLLLTLEQAFRPGEPAAHRRHQRGVQEQVHRDANRCACRRDRVAGLYAQRVRALPGLDGHVEMAGRVGDLAEQRQIARTCEPVRVGLHQ